MDNIKRMAVNHLLRNIDLDLPKKVNDDYLFTLNRKNDLVFLLIASSLRAARDTIHVYFCEEHQTLQPLPLSLNTFCMATAEKYNLLTDYKVDEDEDVHMTLNIKECRKYLEEVYNFIAINRERLTEHLLYNQNRDCDFAIVTNS